jgi:HD-GYP domain-containing protein (c-di-GMP phosphodiesterase class II)
MAKLRPHRSALSPEAALAQLRAEVKAGRGAWISLGARILRVAETYAALLRPQPDWPALAPAKALGVLQAGAGTEIDPAGVAVLAAWLAQGAREDALLARWWQARPCASPP